MSMCHDRGKCAAQTWGGGRPLASEAFVLRTLHYLQTQKQGVLFYHAARSKTAMAQRDQKQRTRDAYLC